MRTPTRRASWLAAVAFAFVSLLGVSAQAQHIISTSTGPLAPSFRGDANSSYFGWAKGDWDGNPEDVGGSFGTDILNLTPTINPGNLTNIGLTRNPGEFQDADYISSSNNIYAGSQQIDLTLSIETDGTEDAGYTTIIIQGNSLSGSGSGYYDGDVPDIGILAVFDFGTINGVEGSYLRQVNAEGETQWYSRWDLVGNQSTYDLLIQSTDGYGADPLGILSVSDMVIDTLWSPQGWAPDTVSRVVPEPSAFALLGLVGYGSLTVRVRRCFGKEASLP